MTQRIASWRQASATSGSSTGVTTKDAPASFASRTAPGSHTVPTPTGYRPIVVAINPRIISKHEGTVFVTSIVFTPPSMAVRQAWKPASALSVRSTPHTPLGKASAIDFIDRLRLVEGGHHPGTCNQAPIEKRIGDFASLYPAVPFKPVDSGRPPAARNLSLCLARPHLPDWSSVCWYIRMTGATATESTRDQIIHAAADSLLENGYSGTSVRSIASKAGVAIGNLQYWFPTKSELLVEAWRYLTAKSVEELRRTLNQLTDPLEVLEVGVESLWDSLRRLGDVQLAAFDLLVQAPRTERLRAYLPELFTRYREVIQEQLDRLEEDGRIRLTVPRDVLVPLVLNTVLGFGLYYVVTRDDESCLRALSAFSQLAASLIEPIE